MSIIDHVASVDERIATQFKESPNLIAYIKALLKEANNIEQMFCDLLDLRYIDTASDATLDIIGVIVGQPRGFIPDNIVANFATSNLANDSPVLSGTFGTLADEQVGSVFASLTAPTGDLVIIDDILYRAFIRARIAKNNTAVTAEEVIAQALFVTGASTVELEELPNAEFNLRFPADLSEDGKILLTFTDLLPKPVGVKMNLLES